jgi:hypothetical protein
VARVRLTDMVADDDLVCPARSCLPASPGNGKLPLKARRQVIAKGGLRSFETATRDGRSAQQAAVP